MLRSCIMDATQISLPLGMPIAGTYSNVFQSETQVDRASGHSRKCRHSSALDDEQARAASPG